MHTAEAFDEGPSKYGMHALQVEDHFNYFIVILHTEHLCKELENPE